MRFEKPQFIETSIPSTINCVMAGFLIASCSAEGAECHAKWAPRYFTRFRVYCCTACFCVQMHASAFGFDTLKAWTVQLNFLYLPLPEVFWYFHNPGVVESLGTFSLVESGAFHVMRTPFLTVGSVDRILYLQFLDCPFGVGFLWFVDGWKGPDNADNLNICLPCHDDLLRSQGGRFFCPNPLEQRQASL